MGIFSRDDESIKELFDSGKMMESLKGVRKAVDGRPLLTVCYVFGTVLAEAIADSEDMEISTKKETKEAILNEISDVIEINIEHVRQLKREYKMLDNALKKMEEEYE